MTELEEKQDVFRSLQDTAELLSLENHPAKQTVEVSGYMEAPGGALNIGWQQIFSPGAGKLAVPPHGTPYRQPGLMKYFFLVAEHQCSHRAVSVWGVQ